MATISDNQAAWWTKLGEKLEVSAGPDHSPPKDDEVIIKVSYVAINPVDWKLRDLGIFPVPLPFVLGSDVAGEVVSTGSKVTRFQKGDRVIGHTIGMVYGGSRHGAFQNFAACRESVVARIPDSLELSRAVVLPLATSTAAVGLYEHLQLRQPSLSPVETSGAVLVWGASSSVGIVAVQLARAAGYEVIATASPRNFALAKELGATDVYDYRDPDVVEKITARLAKADLAGVFDAISEGDSLKACVEILSRRGGGKLVVTLGVPEGLPENIKAAGSHPAAGIWPNFLPAALESGQFKAKPDPIILEGGLASVSEALDLQKKGVSAAKVVVKIA